MKSNVSSTLACSYVLVGCGPMNPAVRAQWARRPEIAGIVRFNHAAPSGYRRGSRALGLGVDAVIAALKAVIRHPRSAFIATNPWIALPLIALRRRVIVTGVYAEPGSRSWRTLRRMIGRRPVVSSTHQETTEWNADGGRSAFARYGTSLGYPAREDRVGHPVRLFVWGTSDRDWTLVDRLVEAVLADPDVELIVANGKAAAERCHEHPRIIHPGYIDTIRFGALLASSDVAFVPLKQAQRAAGQMVVVGALESGVPVATTESAAMEGYIDGDSVRTVDRNARLLPQLVPFARAMRTESAHITDTWRTRHSSAQNIDAVIDAFAQLGA